MRLAGLLLMGLGAMTAWFLGVKGEDLGTLRSQLFGFLQIQDPGSILPAASVAPIPRAAPVAVSGLVAPRPVPQ